MMGATCSRALLAEVAAAPESATKMNGVKNLEFIVQEWVARQVAAENPKHPWLLGRLSRRARSRGFHEARARAQYLERQRLRPSRCRVCRASSLRKCPCAHCARVRFQRCRVD